MLYRSADEKIAAGVCGGIAQYTGVNVDIVRIMMAAGMILIPYGWLVYFIPALFLPEKQSVELRK